MNAPPAGRPVLQRLGTACGSHPWRTIAIWLVLLAGLLAASRALGATYSNDVNLSGTQSDTGFNLLQAHDTAAAGYSGLVVMKAGSGTLSSHSDQVNSSVASLGKLPHVLSASNPLAQGSTSLSSNGTIGYSTVQWDVQPSTLGESYVSQIDTAVAPMRAAGIQVEYGGGLDQLTRPKANDLASEAVGFAVALIVLLLIFGSVIGAILPLVTALVSVLAGISILGIAATSLTFGTASPTLAAMIGIGVGIDYAVFLTTRFRQRIMDDTLVNTTLPQALQGTGFPGYVTGLQASQTEFDDIVTGQLPVIIAVVITVAFLLIMTAFRSLLLAVKAAVLNLFSIAAAYGVIVAAFQWGWARGLLGVSENVPIEAYVPMIMFAIVFGLSMDYEVFLLSRVKEAWDHTGDHRKSVATGLESTGRVITCAALIMIAVFISFVTSTDVVIKQLSVGLAVSVLIDATIVRLILVPAVMYLLGPASWWLPRWIDRILPHLDVEGTEEPPAAAAVRGAVPAEPRPRSE